MARYSIIVKGNILDLEDILNKHDILLVPDTSRQDEGCVIATVISDVDTLNQWFIEPPRFPPYPDGSLLHWSPINGHT